MPSHNILKMSLNIKSEKMSGIIYADLELLIEKIYRYANNPKLLREQKEMNIFTLDIQYQLCRLLIL